MHSPSDCDSSIKPLDPIWVGVAIAVFFPLGFYLLWKHPVLRSNRAWWGAGIAWAALYSVANLNRPAERPHDESSPNASTIAAAEPVVEDAPVKRSMWGPTQLAYKKRVDLCDNPDKYKNNEIKMEVKYRGGGIRQGGTLTSMECTVFYGDGSFEMHFTIPKDVPQPNIQPGQYLWVTFVFSGSVDSPSRVTAIARK